MWQTIHASVESVAEPPNKTPQLWMTIFFLGEKPPHHITLLGLHDFASGTEIDSASATSSTFATYTGEHFRRTGNTLTIG